MTIRDFRVEVTKTKPITLGCGINVPERLLIFKHFSKRHVLISHSTFIHIKFFDQKTPEITLFRMNIPILGS